MIKQIKKLLKILRRAKRKFSSFFCLNFQVFSAKEKKKKRCAMRRKERLRNTLGARAIKGRDSLAKETTNRERERLDARRFLGHDDDGEGFTSGSGRV